MQTSTDQDKSDVWDEFIVADAPEVSFSTTITGTSGSSSQPNQVCDNSKGTQVSGEMGRAGRTSLTARISSPEAADTFAELVFTLAMSPNRVSF